jgi:hypothetical protein
MLLELNKHIIYSIIDKIDDNYVKLSYVCKDLNLLLFKNEYHNNLNYVRYRLLYGKYDEACKRYTHCIHNFIKTNTKEIKKHNMKIWSKYKNEIINYKCSDLDINILHSEHIILCLIRFLKSIDHKIVKKDDYLNIYSMMFTLLSLRDNDKYKLYVVYMINIIKTLEKQYGDLHKHYRILKNLFGYLFRCDHDIFKQECEIDFFIKSSTLYKIYQFDNKKK